MKVLMLILLLAGSVFGEHTPVGFKKWHNGGQSFSKQIGGSVRNYQTGQGWAQINNNFVPEGDSVFKVDASVIKTRVNKNGESSSTLTWGGVDYVITQKLLGIGWLKISTRAREWIDNTMNWSNVSVDSNIVTWTGVSPAVDYRVRKQNGQVEHGIFFKPAFLDSAVVLYNQRADSLDIALANVMVYTLSGNIDNVDSGLGELSFRQLKSFGEYTFKLTDQRLNYAGSDTLQTIPVKQFWRKRNDSLFCIEYVMMSDVKAVHIAQPNVVIWHNDTKKIEGTTNVEDATIISSNDNNLGSHITLFLENGLSILIRAKNLASEIGAGATITDAICSLYVKTNSGDGDIHAFSVFKPWEEGTQNNANCVAPGCSGNDWACDDNEWTTTGAACAGDDGSDNSQDGGACNASGRDRKSTAESTVNVTTVNTWYGWDISNALAQGWYDETKNEEGLLLIQSGASDNDFHSTEASASEKPFFVFTFTVASGGQKVMIRK